MGPRKRGQRLEKLLEEERGGGESVMEHRPFYEVDPVWIQYRTQEELRQQSELYVEGDNMEEVAEAQNLADTEGGRVAAVPTLGIAFGVPASTPDELTCVPIDTRAYSSVYVRAFTSGCIDTTLKKAIFTCKLPGGSNHNSEIRCDLNTNRTPQVGNCRAHLENHHNVPMKKGELSIFAKLKSFKRFDKEHGSAK